MDFGFLGKKAAIGGGIVGAVMFVITLASVIPVVGCFIGLLNWILGCTPGIVCGFLIEKETGRISIGEGAIAGCIGALVAGIISGIATIIAMTLLVGMTSAGTAEMGGMAGGAAVGIVGGIVAVAIGTGIMIPINAGTGAIYALIKNR